MRHRFGCRSGLSLHGVTGRKSARLSGVFLCLRQVAACSLQRGDTPDRRLSIPAAPIRDSLAFGSLAAGTAARLRPDSALRLLAAARDPDRPPLARGHALRAWASLGSRRRLGAPCSLERRRSGLSPPTSARKEKRKKEKENKTQRASPKAELASTTPSPLQTSPAL